MEIPAQMCAVSADFMLRMSQFHGRVCEVCAAICLQCADSCERVGPADTTMSTVHGKDATGVPRRERFPRSKNCGTAWRLARVRLSQEAVYCR